MLRKTNRKAKKRVFTLILLFVFFISSQGLIFSGPVSASVEERDISVEWGDNVFQNLPYDYTGTFYENTDPTAAWDTAKIEFTYIPDPTINDEYPITQDFTNYESKFASGEQNLTMSEGSYSDFDNVQSNDNNYASFNHTGVGHYNATYSFENHLDGTSGDGINFVSEDGITPYGGTCEIQSVNGGHNKVMYVSPATNYDTVSNTFSDSQTDGVVEFWVYPTLNSKIYRFGFRGSTGNALITYFYSDGEVRNIGHTAGQHQIGSLTWSYNSWYHILIDFEVSTHTYDYYLNGVLGQADLEWYSESPTSLTSFNVGGDASNLAPFYIDAVDYNWTSDYVEGRSREDLDPLGHYPASYSFDDQPVWTSGLDIDYVDVISGLGATNSYILNNINEHKKVITLYDDTSGSHVGVEHLLPDIVSGTIDLWFSSLNTYQETAIGLLDAGVWRVATKFNNDFFQVKNASSYINIDSINDNIWYHLSLYFNCDTDKYNITFNGIDYGEFDFTVASDHISKIRINTGTSSITTSYIDAIGFSWEDLIGDNINDNYLLGTETFEEDDIGDNSIALISFLNTGSIGTGCEIEITPEFNEHKKVFRIYDNNVLTAVWTGQKYSSKTSGIIEFYMKTSDITKEHSTMFPNNGWTKTAMQMRIDDSYFWYEGAGWIIIPNSPIPVNNQWYHIKIEFDCITHKQTIWIDDVSSGELDFSDSTADEIRYFIMRSKTVDSGYYCYWDSISYSWEDTNTYFKGSYNQHCNVEAIMDFTVDVPFEYYESFILQVSMDSRYYTNVHTNISWNFYNFTSSSWTEINDYSAITETLREFDDSDVSVGLSGLFDSSGNMKFRYYGYNCSAFYLEIDELTADIYFGTQFEYEHTLRLLGTWKYRFKLDVGLGTEHITDWVYFNLIEQPPNFEGISESRYSTRWVLTSTATTGELTEVYYDDLTSGYWDLSDFTSRTFNRQVAPDHDSYVDSNNPTSNYGSSTHLWIDDTPVQIIYLGFPELNYFTENSSGCDTWIYLEYSVYWTSGTNGKFYETGSFDESTITYNNKPSDISLLNTLSLTFSSWYSMNTHIPYQYYSVHSDNGDWRFYSYEFTARYPQFKATINKHYHTTTGEGYSYMQTSSTESLGLISPKSSSNTSLSEGDVFTVDLQSTSDNALLKLYSGGVLQQTINLLTANTETSRQEVEVIVSEDVSYDQIKITSELSDTEYFKLYDIKAEHWVFESEEDQKIMYVEPYGQNDLILNLGNNSLKIYENDILRTDTYITMTYDLTTHIFESPIPETVFVSFYDSNNDYLDFNQFTTYINYTLFEENFINQRLTSREFYVDEDSTIYFNVYDSFDVNIYSASRLAKTFIDITLSVYTLKIKNEALDDSSYTLTKGSVSKTGILFPDEIDEYKISSGSYTFAYIKGSDPEESIDFTLSGDKLLKINRSQMCFLSYTNQRGEYLNFNQFKTYWNGTLLYENVFYEDIGNNVSIEIKDHYDISVKNHSFIVSSGDNYIPVVLTMYSLKVFNQQELFNHINITLDPNYYESGYSWSEWVAPTEIIEFTLFAGYYKINLTDNENSGSSYYSYTLNGDDILLISSGNIISNVIINIANINATLGNQITNVEINITNQNSQINNSIINVEINLGNINSTLGNMLVNLDLDITNIANNISNLYTFTNNSFINLDNNMNNSFIYMENNIISINQSISNLVIGVSNDIYLINGTISTMITQMENNLLLMNVSIDTALFDLATTVEQIGNNITNNYILLNNSITLANNNINDSRIAIINNLALINNTISNLISQVYSSVYMINNSIYTAVVDVGTSLSLINNTISGNLSIVLEQNDFLTELYRTTMFSDLLNWTNIGYNSSLIDSQIDVWEFINNYKNQSIEVHLRYQDIIDNLTITAQNSIPQYLPKYDTEYREWSIKDQKYLDEWKPLPENRTIDFGFYEEKVPIDPNPFFMDFVNFSIFVMVLGVIGLLGLFFYFRIRYQQDKLNPRTYKKKRKVGQGTYNDGDVI